MVRNWLIAEDTISHVALLKELQQNEPKEFLNYVRMDEEKFNITFILIQPYVQKKDTVMREDIFAEERLITALSYLAIGQSYENLKFSYAILT